MLRKKLLLGQIILCFAISKLGFAQVNLPPDLFLSDSFKIKSNAIRSVIIRKSIANSNVLHPFFEKIQFDTLGRPFEVELYDLSNALVTRKSRLFNDQGNITQEKRILTDKLIEQKYEYSFISPSNIPSEVKVYTNNIQTFLADIVIDKKKNKTSISYTFLPNNELISSESFSFIQNKLNHYTKDKPKGNITSYSEFKYETKFGKVAEQTNYNASGVFTSKIKYEYDPNVGNLISVASYDQRKQLVSNNKFYYNSSNFLEKEEKYNEKSSLTASLKYRYDINGNMIESNWLDKNGKAVYDYFYEYDAQGNELLSKELIEGKFISRETKYTFDKKRNKLEEQHFDTDGNLISKFQFKYDRDSSLVEEVGINESEEVDYRVIYVRNMNNDIDETILLNADGSTKSHVYKTYDANQNVIEQNEWLFGKYNVKKTVFTYDDKGKLTKKTEYDPSENSRTKIDIKYNDENSIIEVHHYDLISGKLTHKTKYNYNKFGILHSEQSFDLSDAQKGKTEYITDYDSGVLLKVVHFDKNNNPLTYTTYTYEYFDK